MWIWCVVNEMTNDLRRPNRRDLQNMIDHIKIYNHKSAGERPCGKDGE